MGCGGSKVPATASPRHSPNGKARTTVAPAEVPTVVATTVPPSLTKSPSLAKVATEAWSAVGVENSNLAKPGVGESPPVKAPIRSANQAAPSASEAVKLQGIPTEDSDKHPPSASNGSQAAASFEIEQGPIRTRSKASENSSLSSQDSEAGPMRAQKELERPAGFVISSPAAAPKQPGSANKWKKANLEVGKRRAACNALATAGRGGKGNQGLSDSSEQEPEQSFGKKRSASALINGGGRIGSKDPSGIDDGTEEEPDSPLFGRRRSAANAIGSPSGSLGRRDSPGNGSLGKKT